MAPKRARRTRKPSPRGLKAAKARGASGTRRASVEAWPFLPESPATDSSDELELETGDDADVESLQGSHRDPDTDIESRAIASDDDSGAGAGAGDDGADPADPDSHASSAARGERRPPRRREPRPLDNWHVTLPVGASFTVVSFLSDAELARMETTCHAARDAWRASWAQRIQERFPQLLSRSKLRALAPARQVLAFASGLKGAWMPPATQRTRANSGAHAGHLHMATCLALSDSERDRAVSRASLVVSAAQDRTLHALNLRDDGQRATRMVAPSRVRCLAVSGSFGQALVAAGCSDGRVRLYTHGEAADGPAASLCGRKRSRTLHELACKATVDTSPHGATRSILGRWEHGGVAVGCTGGGVVLWDVTSLAQTVVRVGRNGAGLEAVRVLARADVQGTLLAGGDNGLFLVDPRKATGERLRLGGGGGGGDGGGGASGDFDSVRGVWNVAAQQVGHGLLVSKNDMVYEFDRRYLRRPQVSKQLTGVPVKMHYDESKAFLALHRPSGRGAGALSVWTPGLGSNVLSLNARPLFHKAGGGGSALLSANAVDLSDSVVVGASASGGALFSWDLDPPVPVLDPFSQRAVSFEDCFELREPVAAAPCPVASPAPASPASPRAPLAQPAANYSPRREQDGVLLF